MNLKQRNQLLINQREAKIHCKEVYPRLKAFRTKVRELESEYSSWYKIYKIAEEKLAKERINYIPRGKSGTQKYSPEAAAIIKFVKLPREKQEELLEKLEALNENDSQEKEGVI